MTDPPTDLLLVRHGQAVCNVTGVVGGPRSCAGLTPLGREQARRLAARLNRAEAVTVMYTAPRLRVQETAQIIGRDIRLAPAIDPLFDGPGHGDADGRPWAEVKTAFGGPPQSSPDRPFAVGAETWNYYLARAADRITRIIQQHEGERVLIVGHAETVEAACTLLLGLPARSSTRIGFAPDHASITWWRIQRYEHDRTVRTLNTFNDTAHLCQDNLFPRRD
jgi:probable phosphoglycerate mutase